MFDHVKGIIGPLHKPTAEFRPYDPRYREVARQLAEIVITHAPEVRIEHIGSTAISNCAGKGIVDMAALYPEGKLETTIDLLLALGFQRQNPAEFKRPWPESRPMLLGTFPSEGVAFPVYIHVVPAGSYEAQRFIIFRDRLRADASLLNQYIADKERIICRGITDTDEYAKLKRPMVHRILGDEYDAPPDLFPLFDSFNQSEAAFFRGRHSGIPGSAVTTMGRAILARRPGAGNEFNKILGLTQSDLDNLPSMEAFFAKIKVEYAIEIFPDHLSPAAISDLTASGYTHTEDMVVLHSPFDELHPAESQSLRVCEVLTEEDFRVFMDVYQAGLGVPPHLRGHPAFSHWWTLPNWNLFIAHDSDRAIGAAVLFVHEQVGYLATASTIPDARNRGAQTELIQCRIRRAKETGCRDIWSQTKPDSSSMRNMLRSGLREICRKTRLVKP